ncbi:DUF2339 domain-containing protein [Planococcus lenghuensis]|uniref:DUF2339 domain-containing protein n=1 Tax=Planococcus lenghuensis TaxID=2213202 RepID=A0A1Q2KY62_9BACL|nr:DUF2339 domain-containing protein [Planococcus lenghuensis]AQQ53141.1 hypothetical protein B0X71_08585 [Planococcus lenghuensis]
MNEENSSDLEQRIKQLEERVAVLEKSQSATVVSPSRPSVQTIQKNEIPPVSKPAATPWQLPPKEQIDWEKRIAQDWLPKVFIFVLLFGVVWAFKAAVDSQLITEPLRVILGFTAAVVMLAFGEKQIHNQRRGLGLTLLGGAVAVLMLTTFAMHMLYGYVSVIPAFLLNILWIAGGLYLTYKHKTQTLGILVAVGGYLVPFLLESDQANVFMFSAYVLVLYLSLFVLSVRLKQRILFISSIALMHLTLGAYTALSALSADPAQLHFLLSVVGLVVLIQQLVVTGLLFNLNLFGGKALPLLFSNLGLTLLWSYAAFNSTVIQEEWGPSIRFANEAWTAYDWVLAGFLVIFMALTYLLLIKKDWLKLKVFSSISLFIATLLLLRVFEASNAELALLIESVVVYMIAIQINSRFQRFMSSVLLVISSWVIVLENLPLPAVFSVESLYFILLIAVLVIMYKLRKYKDEKQEEKTRNFSILALASGLIATLLIFQSALISTALDGYSSSTQSMGVSIGWGLFSIAAALYGIYSNKKKIRLFGIVWILVTLLKLVFVDFEFLSLGTRAILFIILGALGMLMSRLFYTAGGRKKLNA